MVGVIITKSCKIMNVWLHNIANKNSGNIFSSKNSNKNSSAYAVKHFFTRISLTSIKARKENRFCQLIRSQVKNILCEKHFFTRISLTSIKARKENRFCQLIRSQVKNILCERVSVSFACMYYVKSYSCIFFYFLLNFSKIQNAAII